MKRFCLTDRGVFLCYRLQMMKKICALTAVFCAVSLFFAKDYSEKVFLWRGVPGMETQIRDTVLYYCPSKEKSENKANPAVIICPGGSYHHLGMPHEGFASARWFAKNGIDAFVLRYRVAYNEHHYPDQLADLQMAIVHLRENAEKYGIDPSKIGAIGYSAGGHLVTMAGEFASTHNEIQALGINTAVSVRPDFVMPVYPVVSMQDDIAHRRSRKSLLGHVYDSTRAEKGFGLFNLRGFKYSKAYKDKFSMELNVPDDMPPVFLLACKDDPVVLYENSVRLDKALTEKNIEHKFVSYEKGGHGFGMKENSSIMKRTHWNDTELLPWLKSIGVVE